METVESYLHLVLKGYSVLKLKTKLRFYDQCSFSFQVILSDFFFAACFRYLSLVFILFLSVWIFRQSSLHEEDYYNPFWCGQTLGGRRDKQLTEANFKYPSIRFLNAHLSFSFSLSLAFTFVFFSLSLSLSSCLSFSLLISPLSSFYFILSYLVGYLFFSLSSL